jgi:hypothetical protein
VTVMEESVVQVITKGCPGVRFVDPEIEVNVFAPELNATKLARTKIFVRENISEWENR